MHTSKRTQWVRAAATALLVMTSGLTGLAAAQPAHAATVCTLHYSVSSWPVDANDQPTVYWDGVAYVPTGETAVGTGMVVNFELTNQGATLTPWLGIWYTQGGLRLPGQIWNAMWSGGVITSTESRLFLQGPTWNRYLPAGATISFGLRAVLPGVVTAQQVVTAFSLTRAVQQAPAPTPTSCTVINDNPVE